MTESVLLLASGGLDSTTLYYELRSNGVEVVPLFVDYGQHCAATELKTLHDVLPSEGLAQLRAVDVSDIYRGSKSRLIEAPDLWQDEVDYKSLYLPYRTLMLLSVGAAYAQARDIRRTFAGFINSNHAQEIDCSTAFFSSLMPVFTDYGGVEICLPYRELSKREVAARGIALRAPIGKTFSCQVSPRVPCGACPNCVDRLDALQGVVHTNNQEAR